MCDIDAGSMVMSFLPTVAMLSLVSTLGSSQDSDEEARSGAFTTATFGFLAYKTTKSIGSLNDPSYLSDSGVSTTLSDVFTEYAVWFDAAVVAVGVVTFLADMPVDNLLWKLVAGVSGLIHIVGVLLGDYSANTIVIIALMTSGLLDSIGDALGGITDSLPSSLQVRNPPLHKLLAIVLLTVGYLVDETSFEDIVTAGAFQAYAVATAVSFLFAYVEPGSTLAKLYAVASLTAVPLAFWYVSDLVAQKAYPLDDGPLDDPTCFGNLTALEVSSLRIDNLQEDELLWYIMTVASGFLLAAGFVMSAGADIGVEVASFAGMVKDAVSKDGSDDADRGHDHARGYHHTRKGPKPTGVAKDDDCSCDTINQQQAIKVASCAKADGHAKGIP